MLALLIGVLLIFSYDCIRIFRRLIKHGKIIAAVEDIFFWLIWACIVYSFLYQYDYGAVRNYAVIAMAVGICIYGLLISRPFMKYIGGFLCMIKKKIHNSCVKLLKKLRKTVTMVKDIKNSASKEQENDPHGKK